MNARIVCGNLACTEHEPQGRLLGQRAGGAIF
jgi:hypothetical protein